MNFPSQVNLINKSMLKLIDRSAETLGEKTKFLVARQHFQGKVRKSILGNCMGMCSTFGGPPRERKLQQLNSSGWYDPNTNEGELFRHPEDGNELQKEVFAALFSAPEKSDEFPEITVKTKCEVQSIRKGGFLISATYWRTNGKLYTDTSSCIVVASMLKKNSSKLLYRIRFTCFKSWSGQPYEPAIDAFARGDHARAGKLLEQVSDIEEIINVGKLGEEMMSNLEPLTKLQVLYWKKLPNSNSIYWKALPFPDVCRIFVFKCPELKKLPLDLERAGQEVIEGGVINMDGEILEQISGV
ncbi:hypothetical protein WN944_022414 [Citrus x changshan-huyou]|uniref:Uncharacterized protein n=1 Tax=Citrus x changshan-huyou TaxID=2935761 RepID=A0AAP0QW36_9ROSI